MAFKIEQVKRGKRKGQWYYEAFQLSYGLVCGYAITLPEAKVRLAIGEADLLEHSYPPLVKEAMLADPDRFGRDWPDPPYTAHGATP